MLQYLYKGLYLCKYEASKYYTICLAKKFFFLFYSKNIDICISIKHVQTFIYDVKENDVCWFLYNTIGTYFHIKCVWFNIFLLSYL